MAERPKILVTLFNGVSILMIEGSQGTGSQHYNGSHELISQWRIHLRNNPIATHHRQYGPQSVACTAPQTILEITISLL